MARQVRISDDLCDRLSEQGGSLAAAVERTLSWALDTIDAADEGEMSDTRVDEPAQYDQPARAEQPARRARTSSRSAQNARWFAAATRRPW